MPQRALIDKRPWLFASLVAGISFWFVRDGHLPGTFHMLWKGAGVGFLAAYALTWKQLSGATHLAAIMALGASGDMALEIDFQLGAALFMAGHITALAFYLRHLRPQPSGSQRALAATLLLGTPVIAYYLVADPAMRWPVASYALTLGAMAGAAWASAFPRYRVGIGAVLFVASDLLIFARMGPLVDSALPGLLIWPLYYLGQFLVCTGVIRALRQQTARLELGPPSSLGA